MDRSQVDYHHLWSMNLDGTGSANKSAEALDTPTLIESWRTAPYLNVGRAVKFREVFTRFNESDRHGHTRSLSSQQLSNLVEYVGSL